MIAQISTIISGENSNIRHIEAKTGGPYAIIDIIFEARDVNHLNRIITGIRRVPGVRAVERVQRLNG